VLGYYKYYRFDSAFLFLESFAGFILGVYFLFTHTLKQFVLVPANVTSALVIKDGTAGAATIDRKNRHKRATKEAGTPPKMKKIKVSQDVEATYQKFVQHGRKFKRQPKNHIP
jgi:hypothetical protein